jgi:hypothetical protein
MNTDPIIKDISDIIEIYKTDIYTFIEDNVGETDKIEYDVDSMLEKMQKEIIELIKTEL